MPMVLVLQEMEVIYLVTPTTETVNLILKDFKDPKRPQYGDVHLFFLSKVSDALVNRLGADPVSRQTLADKQQQQQQQQQQQTTHMDTGGPMARGASLQQAGRAGG